MNHRRVVVDSLPQAYKVIKEMNLDHDDADYRSAGSPSWDLPHTTSSTGGCDSVNLPQASSNLPSGRIWGIIIEDGYQFMLCFLILLFVIANY